MSPEDSVGRLVERAQDSAKDADEEVSEGKDAQAIVSALNGITMALLACRIELSWIASASWDDEDEGEFLFDPDEEEE